MTSTGLTIFMLLSASTWAELDLKQFCLDKSLNEVVAHPQDCRGFIVCSVEPTVQYCPVGFHFDMKGLVCNWPKKVNCQLSSRQVEDVKNVSKPALTSFAAFDIITGQTTDPMVGYDALNVACRHFGAYFLPHPLKCRSYYLCGYGHIHEQACGAHTLWDFKLQQCVLGHQANCYQFNKEEEKELNLTLKNVSMVCYAVNSNVSSAEAVHLASTKYTVSLTTTTKTTTTTPLPTPPMLTTISTTTEKAIFSNPFNITCPVKRQSYLAHPEDCSKYFMCIMGTAVMTSCPNGLFWDPNKAYCDTSKNVKCIQNKI